MISIPTFNFRNNACSTVLHSETGQSLIEILIAFALLAFFLPLLVSIFAANTSSRSIQDRQTQAYQVLHQAQEAIRSIKEQDWQNIEDDGTFHLQNSNGWSLIPGPQTGQEYNLTISIESVMRNQAGQIIADSGTIDPSTKKITYIVAWTEPNASNISSHEYLTRYADILTITHTTQADFQAGQGTNIEFTNNQNGEVRLLLGTGSGIFNETYEDASRYIFDSSKIEVINGLARLKNQNQAQDSITNPSFDSQLSPWQSQIIGNNRGQTATWRSSGGNPNGYVRLGVNSGTSPLSGVSLSQNFTTSQQNQTNQLSFDWKVDEYVPQAQSFTASIRIRRNQGNSTFQTVWTSGNLINTTGWQTETLDISSQTRWFGSYTIEIDMQLNGWSGGPYSIGYDNIHIYSGDSSPNYTSDNPSIYANSSITGSIDAWQSFSATEIPDGGSIRYQLSQDNGTTWLSFRGNNWRTASNSTHSNSASEINQQIGSFPTDNNQILVRAFLEGNGSQQVALDNIQIGYLTGSGGNNTGEFTSATIDLSNQASLYRLEWTDQVPSGTSIRYQVAANSDNTTWQYIGPDGTSSTYFTTVPGPIPFTIANNQYIKYKAYFETTNQSIPLLEDVTLIYSP